MAMSIAIIILFGLMGGFLFTKIKLPGLLGMLLVGVLIGPYGLNWLSAEMLAVSGDFRKIALIIILLRAGLGIRKSELQKVGKTALWLSFVPGVFEGLTVALVSMKLLGFDFVRGGMLGFILAAVSPAVVVPLMLRFIEERRGMKKGIPVLVLSAASIDDVFAITFFTVFAGFYANEHFHITRQLLNIPLSILLGVLLGLGLGMLLVWLFKKIHIRDSKKAILVLAVAILMTSLEDALKNTIMIASLLGVMALGFIISERHPNLGSRLSAKFNKIWVLAEVFLFVLVGAEVNVKVAFEAGGLGLVVLLFGLMSRSIGVLAATTSSGLNRKERAFVVASYLPKATVQAAIGSIPLSLGVPGGEIILAIAVLSILVTAPLGAILIHTLAPKLLEQENED